MKHWSLGTSRPSFSRLRWHSLQPFFKQIGEGQHLDVFVRDGRAFGDVLGVVAFFGVNAFDGGADGVEHGAGAAPAATDDADLHAGVFFERSGVDVRAPSWRRARRRRRWMSLG